MVGRVHRSCGSRYTRRESITSVCSVVHFVIFSVLPPVKRASVNPFYWNGRTLTDEWAWT